MECRWKSGWCAPAWDWCWWVRVRPQSCSSPATSPRTRACTPHSIGLYSVNTEQNNETVEERTARWRKKMLIKSGIGEWIPVLWIQIIRMFLDLPDPHPDPSVKSTHPARDPSIINSKKNLSDPHLDRKDRGTEPSIRIRTKMSRIHNTGEYTQYGTVLILHEDNFSAWRRVCFLR